MDQPEIYLIRRALLARKQRKIGGLWADAGRGYISDQEFDIRDRGGAVIARITAMHR